MRGFTYAIGLLLISSAAFAKPPQFVSLAQTFAKFVAESTGADFETQLQSWISNIEPAMPAGFQKYLPTKDHPDVDGGRRERAGKKFPFILAHADQIKNYFRIFETDGRAVIEKLSAQYPEADMSGVQVIAAISLDMFNGNTTTLNGHLYVAFGMDMLAHVDAEPEMQPGAILVNDLPVLMAHEFTHALNFTLSNFGQDDGSGATLWAAMWKEGLAEVNSQMLNPGSTIESVYMEKNLTDKCTPANLKIWSKIFLQDAQSQTDDENEQAFSKWFKITPDSLQQLGVLRAGYCLGYNAVMAALRDRSMGDILKLDRAPAYALVQKTVGEWAGQNPDPATKISAK